MDESKLTQKFTSVEADLNKTVTELQNFLSQTYYEGVKRDGIIKNRLRGQESSSNTEESSSSSTDSSSAIHLTDKYTLLTNTVKYATVEVVRKVFTLSKNDEEMFPKPLPIKTFRLLKYLEKRK